MARFLGCVMSEWRWFAGRSGCGPRSPGWRRHRRRCVRRLADCRTRWRRVSLFDARRWGPSRRTVVSLVGWGDAGWESRGSVCGAREEGVPLVVKPSREGRRRRLVCTRLTPSPAVFVFTLTRFPVPSSSARSSLRSLVVAQSLRRPRVFDRRVRGRSFLDFSSVAPPPPRPPLEVFPSPSSRLRRFPPTHPLEPCSDLSTRARTQTESPGKPYAPTAITATCAGMYHRR